MSPEQLAAWKTRHKVLIDKLEETTYDLALARYEGGEYHQFVSTTDRDDARQALDVHLETFEFVKL